MAARKPLTVDTVDGLLKALMVLSRTVDRVLETRAVTAGAKVSLSASKVQILRLLGQRGAQTSTQVARFLGVSKPAVTQIIDSMLRAKLVTRKSGKTDRREVNLELSKKGREIFHDIRQRQRHYVRVALKSSSSGTGDAWAGTLRGVTEALAHADKDFNLFCAQCGAHDDGTCVLIGGDAQCPFLEHSAGKAARAVKRKVALR